ncbi:hypothetical protein [Kitasatospora sp. NPDC054795]
MTRLADFRLETHFSHREFTARYHLTASDAQTMTMAELLALAGPEDREAWAPWPSAAPRPSATPGCAAPSPGCTSRSARTT